MRRTSGLIYGVHKKWLNASTLSYSFPIGYVSYYRPLSVKFVSITNPGIVKGEFYNFPPGNSGLPINESGYEIDTTFTEGYWKLSSESGFVGGNYNVKIYASGFSSRGSILPDVRVVTRPNSSSDWTNEGTHTDALNDTVYRDGISTLPANFAVATIGTNCAPISAYETGEDTVCANQAGEIYTVTDHQSSTYTWQLKQGKGTIINDGDANDNEITVNWGAVAGNDTIWVEEDNGCGTDTVEIPIILNSLPSANAGTPASICNGESTNLDATGSTGAAPLAYTWDNGGTLNNPNIGTPVATPSITTNYTVTVTDNNSCEDNSSVLITVNPLPTPSVSGDNPACALEDANYSTGDIVGHSYGWSLNPTGTGAFTDSTTATPVINWNQVTTGASRDILVIVADTINATGCYKSDTLEVTVNRQPETGVQYYIPDDFNP